MGKIMKNPIIMAIILSSSFFSNSIGLVSTASADDTVIDSQNSALRNSEKQVSDMDQLRGIIDHADDNPIIGLRFNERNLPVSDIRTEKRDYFLPWGTFTDTSSCVM